MEAGGFGVIEHIAFGPTEAGGFLSRSFIMVSRMPGVHIVLLLAESEHVPTKSRSDH